MVYATLTSKGQLTIPKSVRDSLHLQTGDRVAFILLGENEAVLKAVGKSVNEVFGTLHRPGQKAVSVEEMNLRLAERMRRRAR